jgi:hypothetical protein
MTNRATLFGALPLLLAAAAVEAGPYIPPSGQPLFIQAQGREQIAPGNNIVAPSGATEGNWGVLKFSNIYLGDLTTSPTDWNSVGSPLWVDGQGNNEQITGLFWNTQNILATDPAPCPAGTICSRPGGIMDLYWDDATGTNAGLGQPLTDRTADDAFTNFTDGTFLVRLMWATGIDPLRSDIAITGDTVPVTGGFSGFADSFMNVDPSKPGLWTDLLDADYFTTAFGTRDLKLRNTYTFQPSWGDGSTGIFGADLTDPARAFSVPTPSTLVLFAAGALAAGFRARQRRRA